MEWEIKEGNDCELCEVKGYCIRKSTPYDDLDGELLGLLCVEIHVELMEEHPDGSYYYYFKNKIIAFFKKKRF